MDTMIGELDMEKRFEIPIEVHNKLVELLNNGLTENFVPVNVTMLDDNTSEVVESNVKAYLCKTIAGNSFYYLVDSQKVRAAGKHTTIQGPRLSGTRVSDFFVMLVQLAIMGFEPAFVTNMIVTDNHFWGLEMAQFVKDIWGVTRNILIELQPSLGGPTPQH